MHATLPINLSLQNLPINESKTEIWEHESVREIGKQQYFLSPMQKEKVMPDRDIYGLCLSQYWLEKTLFHHCVAQ